jgi:hypothetical protein
VQGADDRGLHIGRIEHAQRRCGGAAFAGDVGTQGSQGLAAALRQRGCPGQRGQCQLARLRAAQTEFFASARHGFGQVKRIRRARSRHCGDRVEQVFTLHPHPPTRRGQQGIGQGAIGLAGLRAGEQPGDALTDERRGVGHGAHHALRAGLPLDGTAAHPGHDADVQRVAQMRSAVGRGLRELLRLHRPNHGLRIAQGGVGRFQNLHTGKTLLQPSALFGEGLDHAQAGGLRPRGQQPADQGAAHIAAADEGGDGQGNGGDRRSSQVRIHAAHYSRKSAPAIHR